MQIKYASNYEISNLGNVKNLLKNKLLTINYDRLKKTKTRARPYLRNNNGEIKGYYLHRIVAEHFIENSHNYSEVNHKDGNFYNNKSSNLEWVSKGANMKHASTNNLIKRYQRKIIIKNKITNQINTFNKLTDCAKFLNYSPGLISRTCSGKRIDKNYDMKYDKEERTIDTTNIIWKPYPESNKYLVSNTGKIKNIKTNRIMMGSKQNGYRFVNLYINRSSPKMNRLIHRMVAQTFLENPNQKPVVNHKDTNILNNHVDNLEWVSHTENMNTAETIKNLKNGKNSKKILQIEINTGNIINTFNGASGAKNITNPVNILSICNYYRGHKKYGGRNTFKTYQKKYIFIFEEDKGNLETYLKIAKTPYRNEDKSIKVLQLDKNTNQIIKTFTSGYEAAKLLNIQISGISQCCQYYKYSDDTRPTYYNLKSYKGFIFKQEVES